MKKTILNILLVACFTSLYAAELPFNMGIGSWNPELKGTTGTKTSPDYDIKDDYGIKKKSDTTYFYFDLRASKSLLPNYRFETSDLSFSGKTTKAINFKNNNFSLNSESKLEIEQYDNALYYTLLLDRLNIDLGINFKTFDGFMSVQGGINDKRIKSKESFDDTFALYYLAFSYDMDLLSFEYSGKYGSQGDSKIQDQSVKLKYLLLGSNSFFMGVELGYKKEHIVIDDSGTSYKGDLKIEGLFAGVIAQF